MSSRKTARAKSTAHPPGVSSPTHVSAQKIVLGELSARSAVQGTLVVAAIVAGALLVWSLHHIILLFFLGMFIATVMDPGVRTLKRWGVPVSLAILLHYVLFFAVALYLVFSLMPVIAEQIGGIAALTNTEIQRLLTERTIALPMFSQDVNVRLTMMLRSLLRNLALTGPDALQQISAYLSGLTSGSLQFLTGLAGSVFTFLLDLLLVLTCAFFLQLERDQITVWFTRFFPLSLRPYVEEKSRQINTKLGQWIRGQLLLCLVIATLTLIVLLILGVPYALTLALLAGFTEFIPYVGPLIGAVPGVMIALAHDGFLWAMVVGIAYYMIQFSENNFIVPLIMKHSVDISAVAILFAMLVGISFPSVIHPVLGILLSIPLASILGIFLEDVRMWQKKKIAGN